MTEQATPRRRRKAPAPSPDLASRLAGRAPRRTVVPIEVTDPGDDVRSLAVVSRQLLDMARIQHAQGELDDEGLAVVRARADEARAALAEHCVDVALVAAPADVWEALLSEHLADDGADITADALPAMLAACAEDESLRDPAWWAERLPTWPFGDRQALRLAVLDLNAWSPGKALGKG